MIRTIKIGLIVFRPFFLSVLFLILLEIGFRTYNVWVKGGSFGLHRPSLCCGYRVRPNINYPPYYTDDRGFRKTAFDFRDYPASKVYKIVTIGDSTTFGSTNAHLLNYPAYMEYLLNETSLKPSLPANKKKIDVINAGVIAYSSHQALNYLKDTILDLKPDMVLISIGGMDGKIVTNPVFYWISKNIPWLHWYINFSLSGKWLMEKLFSGAKINNLNQNKELETRGHTKNLTKKDLFRIKEYEQTIGEMVKLLKEKGVLPVLLPWLSGPAIDKSKFFKFDSMEFANDNENKKYLIFTDILKKISQGNNIPFIYTPFQTPLVPKKHNVHFFLASGFHMNNSGAQVIGYVLAKAIKGILEGKTTEQIYSESPASVEHLDIFDLSFKILWEIDKTKRSRIKALIHVITANIAEFFIKHKNNESMLANYHFSIGFMPFCNIAIYQIQMGKFKMAKKYLDEVIANYPKFAYPYFIYGILYFQQGNTQASVDYFKKALQLDPYFVAPRVYLTHIDR